MNYKKKKIVFLTEIKEKNKKEKKEKKGTRHLLQPSTTIHFIEYKYLQLNSIKFTELTKSIVLTNKYIHTHIIN